MNVLPLVARWCAGGVVLAGAGVLLAFAPHGIADPELFAPLLLLSGLASAFKVSLPLATNVSTLSLSYAIDFAALLLLGADETMFIVGVSALSRSAFRPQTKNSATQTLFGVACAVLTVKAAGLVYVWLGGPPPPLAFPLAELPGPVVGAATTSFVCDRALAALSPDPPSNPPVSRLWHQAFLWSAPAYYVGAAAGTMAASIINRGGYWTASLAAAPLYLTYHTYKVYLGRIHDQQRHVKQVSEIHLATIEALALAIDAKDQAARRHIRRVQVYAAGLAKALDMSDSDIEGVRTAALLHDIGKLAVPEHILSKPGPLTQEEFQRVRIHPQVGAEIIRGVPFPYPVAPLILAHHERWDGKGYPSGLEGETIPLGARILCVVDYFDALMSERPYHRAMSFDQATELLRHESGGALDARVVQTFVEMYPTLAAEADASLRPQQTLTRVPSELPEARPGAELLDESVGSPGVLQDIAMAHREIYALYGIAQAMGGSLAVSDTMALISSKLSSIVPFSCCALFLCGNEHEMFVCRFAIGVESERVRQMTIRGADGLVGWVARNRRPLVNARPSADFAAAGYPAVETTLKSALVCPLMFNERFIGTLSLYHTEASVYTDDHRRLLDRICEQAAAVINNAIVFEQTQEDSLTDSLTALPNTRSMFMHLARELARAERLKTEVSLLVLDLDNFKDINDVYGHHVGDRALRDVADVLRAAIRPYDICVRYAGDEFVVVLSGCGHEEAERKAAELQRAVDGLAFEPRPGERLALSISVGAAVFPHDADAYEDLLARADSRMYEDKTQRKREAGRSHANRPSSAAGLSEIELRRAAMGVL